MRSVVTLPDPPSGFRGSLSTDSSQVAAAGRSTGPVRLQPLAVARPVDTNDVACLVRWAKIHGRTLIPRGAGTGMPGGNVGRGVVLDLRRLDQVAEWEVDGAGSASVRVGSGVVAGDLDDWARGRGWFLPALPSSAPWCTLGGMAANNAAGARSFGYGSIRAWIDEVEVVLADGSVHRLRRDEPLPPILKDLHSTLPRPDRTWPRLRKNASGYGMDRFLPEADPVALFTGSEGTLGVFTGLRLRLAPLPALRGVALVPVEDRRRLAEVATLAGELDAAACEFLGRRFLEVSGLLEDPELGPVLEGAGALALVELDDRRGAITPGLDRLRAWARSFGRSALATTDPARADELWSVRHAASPIIAREAEEGRVSMQFIEDSVVPPHHLPDYLERLEALLRDEETDAVMFGHAGDGNVHVNPLVEVGRPDWKNRVRRILDGTAELVASLGGTLSGEHGDGRIRAPYLERIWGRAWTAAFQATKDGLDPDGILNPGVVLPLPDQDPLDGLSPEPRGRPAPREPRELRLPTGGTP